MATKQTPYTCLRPVRHSGKRYAAGDEIKLDKPAAERLLRLGAIAPQGEE